MSLHLNWRAYICIRRRCWREGSASLHPRTASFEIPFRPFASAAVTLKMNVMPVRHQPHAVVFLDTHCNLRNLQLSRSEKHKCANCTDCGPKWMPISFPFQNSCTRRRIRTHRQMPPGDPTLTRPMLPTTPRPHPTHLSPTTPARE